MSQPATNKPQVRVIAASESLLAAVVALSDANSDQLGHFPASCFEREARAGKILVAEVNDELLGFLLFRVARNRAVIQQLCVASNHRGSGVGRLLTDFLKAHTQHLDGIALHCAREFTDSAKAWKSMGFVAVDEKPGRGKDRRPLTRFWFDHRKLDLWSEGRAKASEDRIVVVMDANVVFDLQDRERPTAQLSMPLLDEWLEEYLSLWVTDELFNEVDRHPDQFHRERRKGFIRSLPKLDDDRERAASVFQELRNYVEHGDSESDRSDLRQLSSAIAGDAAVFVTHDVSLLELSDLVEQHFGLQVLRPSDLIARIDEVARGHEFAPIRLAGTAVEARRTAEGDLAGLPSRFLNHGRGEQRYVFETRALSLVSAAVQSELSLIDGPRGEFEALLGMEWKNPHVLSVPLLRVKGRQIAPTLVRQLVVRCIRRATREGRLVVRIDDPFGSPHIASACTELGFVLSGNAWIKLCLPGIFSKAGFADRIPDIEIDGVEALRRELLAMRTPDGTAIHDARLEQLLWPGKLAESCLPAFIVPIQPRYAKYLFDEALASSQLIGSDPLLIFNCEHVYYRSSHAEVVKSPGRVLWYVSKDGDESVRRIRGCSQVLEVAVGGAKSLFRRFRRLGVYEWKDIDKIAKGNPKGELMAIRFGLTELFPYGVRRSEIDAAFEDEGLSVPPLSMPVRISNRCFLRLYQGSRQGGSI